MLPIGSSCRYDIQPLAAGGRVGLNNYYLCNFIDWLDVIINVNKFMRLSIKNSVVILPVCLYFALFSQTVAGATSERRGCLVHP